MRRIHIVGRKNSGKTTLIVELVRHFTARGLRVGTIKHTHHHHELDTPGKDSHRHREAGASAVGILSPVLNAIFWPVKPETPVADRYYQFVELMSDCDIVLVEGHLTGPGPKVEVWRLELGVPPLAETDALIAAVITDDPVSVPLPAWPRRDISYVAERVLESAAFLPTRPDA